MVRRVSDVTHILDRGQSGDPKAAEEQSTNGERDRNYDLRHESKEDHVATEEWISMFCHNVVVSEAPNS